MRALRNSFEALLGAKRQMTRLALVLVAFIGLLASSLQAAPLHYQIDLVADSELPAHPLDGANLQLNLTWDAAAVAPLASSSSVTIWPTTNTTASLIVSGSVTVDGVYAASFVPSPSLTWAIDNDSQGEDRLHFPVMRFQIGGKTVESGILFARFASTFFNGPSPFYPKPFTFTDATWNTVNFFSTAPSAGVVATVVDASVVAVPEPATLALGFFALAALRRRK